MFMPKGFPMFMSKGSDSSETCKEEYYKEDGWRRRDHTTVPMGSAK